jgi:hypothetical protein
MVSHMEKIDWYNVCQRFFLWQWVICATALAFWLGVMIGFGKVLPVQIPLYYSRPWGEEQLAGKMELLVPVGEILLAAIVSSFLVKKLGGDKVLAALILGTTVVTELILVLAMIRVVVIVL